MSDHVCPGRCNARPRRDAEAYERAIAAWQADMARWAATTPDSRGPEPAKPALPTLHWMPGTPYWCLTDMAEIRDALVDLDRQMSIRLLHADGHGSIDLSERVSSSPEPASPSPAHDQLDELVRWLRDWQRSYWTARRWSLPSYRGESAPALTEVTAHLVSHLTGILSHPEYAIGFGSGVLSWHAEVTAAAQTRPRRVSMQMRCPQCHLATLSRLEGEDRIECRNRTCGENRGGPVVMTVDEYQALAAEKMPTARQVREALRPHRALRPEPGDSRETPAAGPLGVSRGIRIDPDTMRLVFEQPYRESVPPAEFAGLPWPACPRCGEDISVDYAHEVIEGKEPMIVGARVLTEIPAEVVAKPTLWRCTGATCTAGGGA